MLGAIVSTSPTPILKPFGKPAQYEENLTLYGGEAARPNDKAAVLMAQLTAYLPHTAGAYVTVSKNSFILKMRNLTGSSHILSAQLHGYSHLFPGVHVCTGRYEWWQCLFVDQQRLASLGIHLAPNGGITTEGSATGAFAYHP